MGQRWQSELLGHVTVRAQPGDQRGACHCLHSRVVVMLPQLCWEAGSGQAENPHIQMALAISSGGNQPQQSCHISESILQLGTKPHCANVTETTPMNLPRPSFCPREETGPSFKADQCHPLLDGYLTDADKGRKDILKSQKGI